MNSLTLSRDQQRIAEVLGMSPAQLSKLLQDQQQEEAEQAKCNSPTSLSDVFQACGLPHCIQLAALSAETHGLVMIQATPATDFKPSDGRSIGIPAWQMNAEIARRIIKRHDTSHPPVIDYEHQTLYKEKNGHPAPAAGWIHGLQWVEGKGLFVLAELTSKAKQMIQAGEYRFFSPVLQYNSKTGEVLKILMGALTNNPAIHGMEMIKVA